MVALMLLMGSVQGGIDDGDDFVGGGEGGKA